MSDLVWGIGIIISGSLLYYETLSFPGVNTYIRGVIIVFILCGVLLMINSLYAYKLKGFFEKSGLDKNKVFKVFVVIVLTLLYAFILPYLGYILTSFFFLFFTMRYLGVKNYLVLILVTVGFITVAYVGFGILLRVPLPEGILKIFL